MENKFLQPFLKAGLIEVGDNDERLEDIERAITDLQNKIKGNISLLPRYTLVALDPNISSTEHVLAEVEAILIVHWKALRSRFPEVPIPTLRVVLLHALYNAGNEDAIIARIIFLTASNFYPYAKLGKEKDIVEKIISELGDKAEEHAIKEWSLADEAPNLKLATLKISGFKFDSVSIDRTPLKESLQVAAAHDPNTSHGPQHNNGNWQNHFSEHASTGITNVINTAFSQFAGALSPTSIENPVNKFFGDFKKSLDAALANSFNLIRAVERRSKLLWWKETLYSPSLRNSYRSLSSTNQPMVMAFDLYDQLPDFSPASVDYLLTDTLLLLNNTAGKLITFSELFKLTMDGSNRELLKRYFKDIEKPGGRISLTDFISLVLYGKVSVSELKLYTGIDATEQLSMENVAVCILHDLMVQKLISK